MRLSVLCARAQFRSAPFRMESGPPVTSSAEVRPEVCTVIIYLQMMDTPEERSKFEQIYLEYRGLMFHVANKILQNEQDAEDAVHQAFLNVAEHIQKIGAVTCPKTKSYIVTVVENKAIDLYRRRKRHQIVELGDDIPGIQVVYEGENALAACILKLPPRYREAILLRYVQGYSVKEMASILGVSFSAASKLDQRAKARLKDLYEKEGKL